MFAAGPDRNPNQAQINHFLFRNVSHSSLEIMSKQTSAVVLNNQSP